MNEHSYSRDQRAVRKLICNFHFLHYWWDADFHIFVVINFPFLFVFCPFFCWVVCLVALICSHSLHILDLNFFVYYSCCWYFIPSSVTCTLVHFSGTALDFVEISFGYLVFFFFFFLKTFFLTLRLQRYFPTFSFIFQIIVLIAVVARTWWTWANESRARWLQQRETQMAWGVLNKNLFESVIKLLLWKYV